MSKKGGIAQHGHRLPKTADQVFALRQIGRRLSAHRRVDLCQKGSGHLHIGDTAQVHGGGKTGNIAHDPTAQRQHHIAAGKLVLVAELTDLLYRGQRFVRLPVRKYKFTAGQAGALHLGHKTVAVQRVYVVVGDHGKSFARVAVGQLCDKDVGTVSAYLHGIGGMGGNGDLGHGLRASFISRPCRRSAHSSVSSSWARASR